MTDIFLSFNREDQARAKLFAEGFEAQGFKVWWDVGLRTGKAYDEVTETALRTAKAVVWSKKSVQSRWVRAEATLADRKKPFCPACLQALGRQGEAQEAIRRARRALPGEGLDFWIGFARASSMSQTMFQSFSQHFTDVWNATQEAAAP
jgi:hypothetical protein